MPSTMTNLFKRTLTGGVLVILILAAIWLGPYSFTALLLLINMLGLYEFYRLLQTPEAKPSLAAGLIVSATLIICWLGVLTGWMNVKWMILVIPLVYGIFVNALYQPVKKPFPGVANTLLGITCISLPLGIFVTLPFLPAPTFCFHPEIPTGIFLLLWMNDTIAYLAGSRFGKHLLFSRISPRKTWEGSFAGAASCLAAAYILSAIFPVLNLAEWAGLSVVIAVTGTYGDLIKSLLKRSAGVKDSGTLLPGHGGVLDRFDSLLGSAPWALIYLELLKL